MGTYKESHINQYKRYLSGKMTPAERTLFEQELETDPFAKEAMEGFVSLENNEKAAASISSIERKVNERTGNEETEVVSINYFRVASIAASVLFVVGGVFLVTNLLQNKSHLAKNEADKKQTEVETVSTTPEAIEELGVDTTTNTLLLEDSSNEALLDVEVIDREEEPIAEQQAMNDIVVSEVVEEEDIFSPAYIKYENDEAEAPEAVVQTENNSGFSRETNAAPEVSAADMDIQSLEEVSTTTSKAKESKSPGAEKDNFQEGLNLYQLGRLNEAINSFGKSINQNQKVAESNYYTGLSYYALGKETKAVKFFDAVIGSSSSLKDNAKWYKAIIYINKGKNADAKKLLRELINTGSSFKSRAEEKIKTL